jgi:uncharacterized MAPEG superfamily protein
MPVELTMLAYSVALLIVLVVIQANAGVSSQGLMPLVNSRDGLPAPTGFHARMLRVVDNHREGLTMFAPLAIVAAMTTPGNAMVALGAQLFFYSRVVHAVLYVFGVPLVRPLVWAVGLVGTVLVLLAILKIV